MCCPILQKFLSIQEATAHKEIHNPKEAEEYDETAKLFPRKVERSATAKGNPKINRSAEEAHLHHRK